MSYIVALRGNTTSNQRHEGQTNEQYVQSLISGLVSTSINFDRCPQLQVGTIDKLVTLSDELVKLDPFLGSLTRKIKRAYYDVMVYPPPATPEDAAKQAALEAKNGGKPILTPVPPLKIQSHVQSQNTITPDEYINTFSWNNSIYGSSSSGDILKTQIQEQCMHMEDELKSHIAKYNESKNNVTALERRENGSLLIRPISHLINPNDLIETEHFTTILLAVSRQKEKEFEDSYMEIERVWLDKVRAEEARAKALEAKEKAERDAKERALGALQEKTRNKKPTTATGLDDEEEEEEIEPEPSKSSQEEQPEPKLADKYIDLPTVVPDSAKKLIGADVAPNDEFSIYRVVLLKRKDNTDTTPSNINQSSSLSNQDSNSNAASDKSTPNVEKYKALCRDRRWTYRPFVWDGNEVTAMSQEKNDLYMQRKRDFDMLSLLCEQMFEEVFVAWIHVLSMRVYVESRLMFGLDQPPIVLLVAPKKNQDRKLRDVLNKITISNKDDKALYGVAEDGSGEYFPYVSVNVDAQDL